MIDDFRSSGPRPRGNKRAAKNTPSHPEPGDILPEPTGADQPPFRTPEQVAMKASRINLLEPRQEQELLPEHATPPKRRLLGFLRRKPTKKQAIIMGVAAVLLIGGGAVFALLNTPEPAKPKPAPAKVAPKPQPKPILSPLTGLPVTAEQQVRPVTAVMIENSPDARPQSGLKDAGIVFEAIAEYGITRFMALFQEANPANVGPVRSARPYYIDWALAFDANYAHVGGSPDALQKITAIGIRDLDQFYNSGAYWRISQRFAPHNVYTSLDKLVEAGNNRGYTKSTFTPLPRKEKETPAKVPAAKSIDFAISSAFYNVHYDYQPTTNSYSRVMGGSPHTDNESGAQIAPKVVIALAMPYSLMSDGYHSMYQTVGSGNMLVFQDGVVTPGTWSKADPKAAFEFKDNAGAALKLNPGQTWITALGDISQATYAP